MQRTHFRVKKFFLFLLSYPYLARHFPQNQFKIQIYRVSFNPMCTGAIQVLRRIRVFLLGQNDLQIKTEIHQRRTTNEPVTQYTYA